MVVKEEEEEERREEDEQEEEVAFVPTSRAQLDAVCHFFTFLPSPFRAPLLLPFLSLSLCFTFFPCARQSPRRPLVPPFPYFLVSTCLPLSLSHSISFPSPGCILFHG